MSDNHARVANWVVLVVDDEPDSIMLVKEILEFYGGTVHHANDGQEALEVLEDVTPHVVLTDLSMPNIDGWDLLKHIQNHPEWKDLPVIAMTAHAMKHDVERGQEAGFTAYITKPISVMTLLDDIVTHVPTMP